MGGDVRVVGIEDVLLLLGGQLVDLADVLVRRVLDLLLGAVPIVLRQAIVFEILEERQRIAAGIADADSVILGDLLGPASRAALRRSSVSRGIPIRITLPSLLGVSRDPTERIAFSI